MEGKMKKALLIVIGLLVIGVFFTLVGSKIESYFPAQKPAEIASLPIGDTVVTGMDVVNEYQVRKASTLYHPEYLWGLLKEGRYINFYNSLITGTADPPMKKLTGEGISNQGLATGYKGPGFLTVTNNKLTVKSPETFVWGYMTPYTVGVKKKDGIDIQENGKSIKFVATSDISNSTIPHDYITVENVKTWFNRADEGESIPLVFAISKFSDGRNLVPPSKIESLFGKDVLSYMKMYPNGTPVMVYNNAQKEEVVSTSVSVEESYPEYNDYVRAQNAKSFVQGWNNTIIPPQSASHGRTNATFQGVFDEKEGYVSHGVCPPGRSLRDAVMQLGLPLPGGMTGGYFSIAVESNPTTDVLVKNTANYPVKIVMWYEGDGPSMRIYTNVVKYS